MRDVEVLPTRSRMIEKFPKNGVGAELGVDKGDFSEKLLQKSSPQKLILVDAWDSERYDKDKMREVKKKFRDGNVSIRKEYSIEFLESMEDNYLDWVYIDTSHSYKQTLKELKMSHQKVRDDGIIAGHDYCQGNIRNFSSYGVIEAVHQFCLEYDYEIKYLTLETHGHRSFGLRKL